MRRGRLFILIAALLTLLVLGAALMHPLVRFTLALRFEGFDRAESVYLSRIQSSEKLDGAAREQLRRYVAKTAAEYYSGALTYAEATERLVPLTQKSLPQDHIAPTLKAVREMEAARTDLAQADACAAGGDLVRAIPLYRRSLIADEGAAFRLKQAETAYKNSILEQAETAMDAGQYAAAEKALQEGLALLGTDDDLALALEDVGRM